MNDAVAKSGRLRFENTINWGHVLTFLGMIAGGFLAFSAVKEAVSNLDTRLIQAEQNITSLRTDLSSIIPTVAVNAQRLLNLESSIDTTASSLIRIEGRLNTIQTDVAEMRGALLPQP